MNMIKIYRWIITYIYEIWIRNDKGLVNKARKYAARKHLMSFQFYDNHTYFYHLKMAYHVALYHISLIPEEDRDEVLAGVWCHDIIEDARETYNDVKTFLNSEIVAEYAYALTNEKGKNRKQRASRLYYIGINEYKHATFIKLCDRVANVSYGILKGSNMTKKYKKELSNFKSLLYDGRYSDLWKHLEFLLK